jgi:membrane-associated phospholipid phosphatase
MMRALSALGDTALLAPASVLLLLYLAALRRWVDARAFAATLAIGLGATLFAKLLFKACGGSISVFDVNSPSGHASFAALFYGSLAVLIGAGRARWQAVLVGLPAMLLVAAIGFSRIALDAHSWPEVVLGWAIGILGIGALVLLRRSHQTRPLSPVPLAIGLVLAIAIVDGRHFTPEHHIGRLARYANTSLDICTQANARVTGVKLSVNISPP